MGPPPPGAATPGAAPPAPGRAFRRRLPAGLAVVVVAGGLAFVDVRQESAASEPPEAEPPAARAPDAPASLPAPGRFSDQANLTWGTSMAGQGDNRAGKVVAMAEAAGHVYFAGEFTGVVPPGVKVGSDEGVLPRHHLVRLDIATGRLDHSWDPDPDRPVRALAVSPDGRRLYAGGTFNRMDGHRARKLMAFDVTTGRLDPTFRAPRLNREVRALALSPDGRRLYAGGNFTEVEVEGNQPDAGFHQRSLLAAFDARTGALLDWEPPRNGGGQYVEKGHRTRDGGTGAVEVLAMSRDGSRLYAGGTFLRLGGEGGLVSIDTATGRTTSWQPGVKGCSTGNSTCRPFYGIAVAPDDPDSFYAIADGLGGFVASFTYGRQKPNWEVRLDGAGMAVAATRELVYIGGHFDCAGARRCNEGDTNAHRKHLAALDPRTGTVDRDWTATANTKTGPYSAYIGREHLYIGGEFSRINGRPQPGFAQFPARR